MRLLVIEDEKRIATAIKRVFELHSYAVDIVEDAVTAEVAMKDPDYDLIILDRMLPGKSDGLALCKAARRANVHKPILMLTALGEVDDRVEGLQAGADDYLVKPFAMKELIARVEVLLRRPPVSIGSLMSVDDLEVDTAQYSVKRSGVTIHLSNREFKLLVYLLYNQGQVLTKDKIISHVWNNDALIMPNTVEVYIGYLRKKIDKNFPNKEPLIHTVRGFGYRLGI